MFTTCNGQLPTAGMDIGSVAERVSLAPPPGVWLRCSSMVKAGRELEPLTEQFLELHRADNARVERDVNLEGPDGPRQFDVVVVDGLALLTFLSWSNAATTRARSTVIGCSRADRGTSANGAISQQNC